MRRIIMTDFMIMPIDLINKGKVKCCDMTREEMTSISRLGKPTSYRTLRSMKTWIYSRGCERGIS